MTDREMRVRLAQAMGWTDLETVSPCGRMRGLWGSEPAGWFCPGSPARSGIIAPDPLEDDRDAARLRAWCVERGWTVRTDNEPASEWVHGGAWPAAHVKVVRAPIVESSLVREREEPDPCRRERLALCRAVLRAIEVQP